MIYFDNAATTRALPSVAEKMSMMLCEQYGNPASPDISCIYFKFFLFHLANLSKMRYNTSRLFRPFGCGTRSR